MKTFSVPCNRCAEKRAEFEALGFVVHDCNPDPTQPGMCLLRFEDGPPFDATAAAPAGSQPAVPLAPTSHTPAAASAPPAKPQGMAAAPEQGGAVKRMLVNVDALNLRSSPSSATPDNVIATLHLAQALDVIGPEQQGWVPVVLADGGPAGFVKGALAASSSTGGIGLPSLRAPASSAREALVAEAVRQWARFRFGQGKEGVDPFFKFIGEMWQKLGLPHDGRDDIPWSAATISFIVRNVATRVPRYGNFKFNASHSVYIHDAIKRAGDPAAPFHGFRLFEHKPQVGDLVARSRDQAITFEMAAAQSSFKSHTDIIVAVHPDAVLAIGGNVSDSVSLSRYAKTASGHLSEEKGVFAHIVNNA